MAKILWRRAAPFLALVVMACNSGGGGSDSGGGTANPAPPAPQPPAQDYTGTYDGTLTITFSAAGLSVTESQAIRITIDGNGLVTIGVPPSASSNHLPQCGDILNVPSAQLVGNTFTFSNPPVTCLLEGYECTFADTGTGTVDGNTITGTYMATQFVCAGIPIQANGTFTATKVQAASFRAASRMRWLADVYARARKQLLPR